MQYQSVYDLIRRALPGKESCFLLREMKVEEAATGQNCYCVSSEGEKIILSGDCVISLCMAFYAYLREECGVNLSWCGNREIAVPEELPVPAVERRYAVPQQHRVYMNYCTFGYSALVWDWARWEKEIDFMAMNGVNMPLSIIGTQGVWFETLLEYGFTEREALAYLSGPAYWPWQLMTNLEGAMPPPDRRYVEQSISLGRKILERERSLGMTPYPTGLFRACAEALPPEIPAGPDSGNRRLVRIPTDGAARPARSAVCAVRPFAFEKAGGVIRLWAVSRLRPIP